MEDLYNYYHIGGLAVCYSGFWTMFFIVVAILGENVEQAKKGRQKNDC